MRRFEKPLHGDLGGPRISLAVVLAGIVAMLNVASVIVTLVMA